METQSRKNIGKKFFVTLLLTLLVLCTVATELGAWGYGHVYVVVRNRYYRPVSYARVSVGSSTCRGYGNGYYRHTASLGRRSVYVGGRCYRVNVRRGYNYVNVYH